MQHWFGLLLRGFRERRGWSQQDLSRRSGYSRTIITNYENGKRRPLREATQALAAALELTPDEAAILNAVAYSINPYGREWVMGRLLALISSHMHPDRKAALLNDIEALVERYSAHSVPTLYDALLDGREELLVAAKRTS